MVCGFGPGAWGVISLESGKELLLLFPLIPPTLFSVKNKISENEISLILVQLLMLHTVAKLFKEACDLHPCGISAE